tara:strand:+ start:77 stop:556 length:480 start_codon:yes stop_codon:yes gene_type:complete
MHYASLIFTLPFALRDAFNKATLKNYIGIFMLSIVALAFLPTLSYIERASIYITNPDAIGRHYTYLIGFYSVVVSMIYFAYLESKYCKSYFSLITLGFTIIFSFFPTVLDRIFVSYFIVLFLANPDFIKRFKSVQFVILVVSSVRMFLEIYSKANNYIL